MLALTILAAQLQLKAHLLTSISFDFMQIKNPTRILPNIRHVYVNINKSHIMSKYYIINMFMHYAYIMI